ncbi:MAG: CoA transferase [Myxococcota bacterium]|nr:CoA transferase [Myxococcota bacterium]
MAAPLEGIRVVDCTSMISGPLATMLLGDQGADVIKVESPGTGDLVRHMGAGRRGMAPTFATANRNKRSIALDLREARAHELLEALVARADVFVQNFRPGTAERMGIGEEALRRVRPDLVYVSITGFGETGPFASKRVYDPLVQALSGLASIQGAAEGRPRMLRLIVPDKLTAMTAAQAITAALFARERGHGGQHVRLSMLDAMVSFLWPEGMAGYTWRGDETERSRVQLAQDLVFETRDGFMTAGTVSDAEWRGFCRAVDRPEWIHDERFATTQARVTHVSERLERMALALKERSTAEWLERLDDEQVPCAPILTREELLTHPQIAANQLLVESEHPHAGPMRETRPAARFDATPAGIRRPAPLLGEHTDEILREVGLGDVDIARLRGTGIVA